jgi:surface polysaccharide O-acyltransferase-like enzyme
LKQRIYYLDNIRAIAVLVLIPYHSARIYDWPPFYLKIEKLVGFEIFTRSTDIWIMPLFFMIAGASTVYSLGRRSTIKFISERVKRLMVPFIIGMLTVIPVNGYYAYLFHSGETIDFIDYLPIFFTVESLDGYYGTFTVSHLWFLIYLMLFSLFAPMLAKFLGWLKTNLKDDKPLFNLMIAIGIVLGFLIAARLSALPYPNPLYFAVFYFAGLFVLGLPLLNETVIKFGKYFLITGLVTLPVYMFARISPGLVETGDLGYETLQSINALVWTLTIIYAGHTFLQNESDVLKWINKQGLWIYIIHAPVISCVAFYLLPFLKIPVIAWVVIVLLSYLITLPLSAMVVSVGDRINK